MFVDKLSTTTLLLLVSLALCASVAQNAQMWWQHHQNCICKIPENRK